MQESHTLGVNQKQTIYAFFLYSLLTNSFKTIK